MIEDWDLVRTNMNRLSQYNYEVAVIPTCAIEPHNRHLPEGQDFLHTTEIVRRCCKNAWQECQSIICLPAIPFGVDCNQLDFTMAVHVSQKTLDKMLREIIVSLLKHSIKKVVIINGHGGNDFIPLIRQIQCDIDVHVFLCNWWQVGLDKYEEIFEQPDDHAGEFETSVALNLYPDLVEMDNAGDGRVRPFRFEALQKGWVRTSRNFSRLNDNCASGIPSAATAEKGKKYLDIVCARISQFLIELAQQPIDEYFPHKPDLS
jgi:creatinine amidohydrolase